jgi:hypothetical protein
MSFDRVIKRRTIAIRIWRKRALSQDEDTSEVVADGGDDGVGSVPGTTFEIAASEVTFSLHMADHGLDRGSASQLTLDDAEHAALLAGDEDAARILRVVAALALVDIAALDLAADEFWVFSMMSRRV